MDKHATRLSILNQTLPHVAFDGWTRAVLERGAEEAGFTRDDVSRTFPGGALEALNLFVVEADARMLADYAALEPPPQKIRERVKALIRLRLEAYEEHREAARRGLALYALHAVPGTAALARTADAMWRAAGDTSADFNWYTKRLLLSGVYASTLLYWLNDGSENHEAAWRFLDRRIENVMQIEKTKQRLKAYFMPL
jgi:ubiquinone biosynthesis protein COQ9